MNCAFGLHPSSGVSRHHRQNPPEITSLLFTSKRYGQMVKRKVVCWYQKQIQ